MKDKFFVGKMDDFKITNRGWFVGSFLAEGHPCKTDQIEVSQTNHKAGDLIKSHYHQKKVELLIFLEGKVKYNVNDQEFILEPGMFLFADINNVISGEFLEDSKIFAIHSPSLPKDKVEVD